MGRSIELNPSLGPAIIPGRIMQELYAHARVAAPEECCGLITGTDAEPFLTAHRITNSMNRMHHQDPVAFPRDNHEAFYMAEPEVIEVARMAEDQGQGVTAVYHSHVGSGVYLSSDDVSFAEHPLFPFPGVAQLVISVLGETVEGAGLFLYDPKRGEFDRNGGRMIEVSDA
jgi:proteasome lid subunit RPN8/RPN11